MEEGDSRGEELGAPKKDDLPEPDIQLFPAVKSLLNVCLHITEEYRNKKYLTGAKDKNPVEIGLKNYISMCEKAPSDIILEDFKILYNNNRRKIIEDLEDWLEKINTTIHLGGTVLKSRKRGVGYTLHLSTIYRYACKLFDLLSESPDEPSGLFPTQMAYYLLMVFREVAPEGDKKKLTVLINEYAKDVGEVATGGAAAAGGSSGPDLGGLGGLFEAVSGTAKQLGIPLPDNAPMPTEMDLKSILGNVLNNKVMHETIGSMFAGLKDAKNAGEALGTLTSKLQDPKLLEEINKIIPPGMMSQPLSAGGTDAAPSPSPEDSEVQLREEPGKLEKPDPEASEEIGPKTSEAHEVTEEHEVTEDPK